jgi:hypothetical protein
LKIKHDRLVLGLLRLCVSKEDFFVIIIAMLASIVALVAISITSSILSCPRRRRS